MSSVAKQASWSDARLRVFFTRYFNQRILLEIAPGFVFFGINYIWGLIAATIAIITSTCICTLVGYWSEKRIPVLPIASCLLVFILGCISLTTSNSLFIKIQPTIGNLFFALMLAVGLILKKSVLHRALEGHVYLTERGWKVLTIFWISFAVLIACTNEVIWRTQTTDVWVTFKAGIAPISIIIYIVITRLVAEFFWLEPEDLN